MKKALSDSLREKIGLKKRIRSQISGINAWLKNSGFYCQGNADC